MNEFHESDFAPLDSFPLRWRWTQPSHAVLAPDVLATIRPLSARAAAQREAEAVNRCVEEGGTIWVETLALESAGVERVQEWFSALRIDPTTPIIVSWHADTAVVTEWHVFAAHWDDFCYPSSDDVSIWAPDADWTLCYRHDDLFHFSPSRPAV